MFEAGMNVVYGSRGICRIEAVGSGKEFGMPKDAGKDDVIFYKLTPLFTASYSVIYTPVDAEHLRRAVSIEEAEQCLKEIALFEAEVFCEGGQGRLKEHYKELTASDEPKAYLMLIKEVCKKRAEAEERHKKLGQVDSTYLKKAEDMVCREFAAALGISPAEVKTRIYNEIKI